MVLKALQGSVEGDVTEVVPPTEPITTEQLWVEKYAPSSFTELLSDEKINREVVRDFLCFFLLHVCGRSIIEIDLTVLLKHFCQSCNLFDLYAAGSPMVETVGFLCFWVRDKEYY